MRIMDLDIRLIYFHNEDLSRTMILAYIHGIFPKITTLDRNFMHLLITKLDNSADGQIIAGKGHTVTVCGHLSL